MLPVAISGLEFCQINPNAECPVYRQAWKLGINAKTVACWPVADLELESEKNEQQQGTGDIACLGINIFVSGSSGAGAQYCFSLQLHTSPLRVLSECGTCIQTWYDSLFFMRRFHSIMCGIGIGIVRLWEARNLCRARTCIADQQRKTLWKGASKSGKFWGAGSGSSMNKVTYFSVCLRTAWTWKLAVSAVPSFVASVAFQTSNNKCG